MPKMLMLRLRAIDLIGFRLCGCAVVLLFFGPQLQRVISKAPSLLWKPMLPRIPTRGLDSISWVTSVLMYRRA